MSETSSTATEPDRPRPAPSTPPRARSRWTSRTTALVVIDMQRDFLLPGGFGETLGNDVSLLQKVVPPLAEVLAAARAAGHAGHPHPRGPPARPVGLPTGEAAARQAIPADR